MKKDKTLENIRLVSFLPFILLFLYVLYRTVLASGSLSELFTLLEVFLFLFIVLFFKYWWIFALSIISIIVTSIMLRKSKDTTSSKKSGLILKIIRFICFIPFFLVLYIIINNIVYMKGIKTGLSHAFQFMSEGILVFIAAGITIVVITYFLKKK